MKKPIVFMLLIMGIGLVSCSSQVRELDLTTKAVYRINLAVGEEETSSMFYPKKVFMKRLDDAGSLEKGTIIATEVRDDNGNYIINSEPGTYVVIAVIRPSAGGMNVSFFDEKIMNKTKRTIKAGEDMNVGKVWVVEKAANLFGQATDLQIQHRKIIGQNLNASMYSYRLCTLHEVHSKDDKKEKTKSEAAREEENLPKIEEYK